MKESRKMKKTCTFILIVVLLLSIAGCSNVNDDNTQKQLEIEENYLKLSEFITNKAERPIGTAKNQYADYKFEGFTCSGYLEDEDGNLDIHSISFEIYSRQVLGPNHNDVKAEIEFNKITNKVNVSFIFDNSFDSYNDYGRGYFSYDIDYASFANNSSEDNYNKNVKKVYQSIDGNFYGETFGYLYPEDVEKDLREKEYIQNLIDDFDLALKNLNAGVTLKDLGFDNFEPDGKGLNDAAYWPECEYTELLPQPTFNHSAPKLKVFPNRIVFSFTSSDLKYSSNSIAIFEEYVNRVQEKGFVIGVKRENPIESEKENPFFYATNSKGQELELRVTEDGTLNVLFITKI